MNLLKIAFRRETIAPVIALTFASVLSVALVGARIVWTGNWRYAFLVWNLFLAWLPLVFALGASELYRNAGKRDWRLCAAAIAWLLFFPNAPYIFTDLIHLTGGFWAHFWVDLVLILLCALTGLILGFVSLYLMQSLVEQVAGKLASWVFIAATAALSGFGIYLGRFLRFNSWDVLVKPMKLFHSVSSWAADPLVRPPSLAFPVLFGVFLFIAYVMLYGLTHLKPMPAVAFPSSQRSSEAVGGA